jgi:predicted Fe-Mo cluster-binding NifX family protein
MARETQVVPSPGVGSSAMLRFIGQNAIDALICGELGIASRNALEMLGVQLIPGCSGSAEEAVSRFLAGETQGDPTVLSLCREDDPDDPMNCMHDCSKCSGCGMSEIPEAVRKQIPEV